MLELSAKAAILALSLCKAYGTDTKGLVPINTNVLPPVISISTFKKYLSLFQRTPLKAVCAPPVRVPLPSGKSNRPKPSVVTAWVSTHSSVPLAEPFKMDKRTLTFWLTNSRPAWSVATA